MTDTMAGEAFQRKFDRDTLTAIADHLRDNPAPPYSGRQCEEMVMWARDEALAAQPSAGAQGEGIVLRFGLGELVVNTGKFGGECAVFIAKAKEPGIVGQETGRAAFDRDCLQPGEHVFLFPSVERANEVADALVAATPAPSPVDWERVGPKLVEALEQVRNTTHYSTGYSDLSARRSAFMVSEQALAAAQPEDRT